MKAAARRLFYVCTFKFSVLARISRQPVTSMVWRGYHNGFSQTAQRLSQACAHQVRPVVLLAEVRGYQNMQMLVVDACGNVSCRRVGEMAMRAAHPLF